jgi:hypothetical protein
VTVRRCKETQAPDVEEGEIVAEPTTEIHSETVRDLSLTLRQLLEKSLICEYPTIGVAFN